MPRDLIGRIDWDLIEPGFASKIFDVLAACRKRGADYYVICGTRSFPEQQALYDQGRTKPGKIVTKAKPGQSFHNFGLSVDVCRDANQERSGLQPDFNLPAYAIFAEEAKAAGLDSGYYWKFKDAPHVQPAGLSLKTCQDLFKVGGLNAVWTYAKGAK